MAVTLVRLHWNGATGKRSKGDVREYSAVYRVRTNDARDQAQVICDYFRDSGTLPYIASVYAYANDSDPSAICDEIEPIRQDKSLFDWEVRFHYATPDSDKKDDENPDNDGQPSTDPEKWQEEWDFSTTTVMMPAFKAVYRGGMKHGLVAVGREGLPLNSALMPFIPTSEREVDIQVWRRSFYRKTYGNADLQANTVNDNDVNVIIGQYSLVLTAPQYTLRLKSPGARLVYINGATYWHLHREWWKHPISWRDEIPDKGNCRLVAPGLPDGRGGFWSANDLKSGMPAVAPIVTPDGQTVLNDILLDGKGQPLIDPTAGAAPPTVFLTYSYYPEVNFPNTMFTDLPF